MVRGLKILVENTLFGVYNKVQIAIDRLRFFEPPEGYYLAFSGGKDSIVIEHLADMAGVKYQTHFSMTTVDPPELLHFIERYNGVHWHRPEKTMFQLIIKKGPPTRLNRFCCAYLKETGGIGRLVVTGVRWQESVKRKARRMVELCYKDNGKSFLHPIIDWTEEDVWEFIRFYELSYCSLYDEHNNPNECVKPISAKKRMDCVGCSFFAKCKVFDFKRIGCVLCPMQTNEMRKKDIERFPKFAKAYLRAFDKMLEVKKDRKNWKTAEDVMAWWIGDQPYREEETLFSKYE